MMYVFDRWTCIFPGKLGLSWKHAPPYEHYATKEEAEAVAAKNCNVVAVPSQLFEKMKEHERRMVAAERELAEIKSRSLRPGPGEPPGRGLKN